MPPTSVYKLINNLIEMQQDDLPVHPLSSSARLRNSFSSRQSNQRSILLDKIKDQQIYLCLTNTLLRMAKEAGAPETALQQVGQSLLAARGLECPRMLADANQPQESLKKRRESYNWLDRGANFKEEQALLAKVEKELVNARERQSHYRCLIKFKSQKQDEIAPNTSGSPSSRKQRFKRMMRSRVGVRAVQSSNFYEYQVNQILQNSFKYQNECYRTVGSFSHLKTMFGHASDGDMQAYSQIFNAILDKSENLVISGGEEGLIKIWHRSSGTLISNLKGHSDYLNKIDTSKCNKYLLTTAGDGIRFFDLRTLKPLGGWKTGTIPQISSFIEDGKNIFLFGDNSCLYVLTQQVMLAKANQRLQLQDFYHFYFGDIIGKESSPILVISLSPNKTHILLGLQSGQMLIVLVSDLLNAMSMNQLGEQLTLPCLLPVRAHYEQIIQVKWSNTNTLWATGAKDGRCCLWQLRNGQAHLLTTLTVGAKGQKGRRKRHNYTCSYICWNCTFSHFAAGFQENMDEEDSDRGHGQVLVYSLKERRVTSELSRDVSQQYGGIRAMDAHPYYPNILLICEADGNILLFDIFIGCVVNAFQERGYHILHPQFQLIPTECHFSQDGLSFIVATEYGSVSIYGYDSKVFYSMAPIEQFLKTDFQQFAIEEGSMRALPLTLQFQEDLNSYPRGDILGVRGQKHLQAITMDAQGLLFSMNNPVPVSEHFPEIKMDASFLKIISHNLKQIQSQQQIYAKTYEQIERIKQLVLFHERQRQYNVVQSLTNQKIKSLKVQQKVEDMPFKQQEKQFKMMEQEPTRKRQLKRHAQRQRVSYVDDFQYNDSQEEDYEEFVEPDVPQQLAQSFSEAEDEEDQGPRLRKRQNRNKRITRQSNNVSRLQLQQDSQPHQPERNIRKRRRDMSEDNEEIESQNQPKKRPKLEDQQSQNRTFSRLRKHVNQSSNNNNIIQQGGDCYRCQIAKATQFCFKCQYTQQFCEDCALLRGKRLRDKYQCIICLYLNNKSDEEHEHVTDQCYRATAINLQSYVPQLQDFVRFFFQGYEEFLVQNINKLNTNVYKDNNSFRLLPHTEDVNLVNTPLCQVISIQYYFPMKSQNYTTVKRNPGKGEKSPILMLVGLKPVQQGQNFWIFYYPGQQYLLLDSIYSQIKQKDIISKLLINELITLKEQEMQIVQLGPIEDRFPESIWKVIKIRKTEGKRLRGNTKDIQRRLNIWKISSQIQIPQKSNIIQEKHSERLIQQITSWIGDPDSQFCLFIDYVDFQIYPKYREQIPVGMCLQTILSRLESKYYSSYLSLENDIKMINDNSFKFNGPTHFVTKCAQELVKFLLALLSSDEAPIPSHSKGTQEDSIIKKQKNVRDSQEIMQSFSNEGEQRRRTRRQEQQRLLKRRRIESSDYSQQSVSQERFKIGISTRGCRTRHKVQYEEEPKRMTRSNNRR